MASTAMRTSSNASSRRLQFGGGIVGNHAVDLDTRLMQEHGPDRETFGEAITAEDGRPGGRQLGLVDLGKIDEGPLRHHFGQHHGDGGERFLFLFVIMTRRAVLHGEHAEDALPAHDGHAKERAERVFAGLGPIGETRMLGRVGEVQGAELSATRPTSPSPAFNRVRWTASRFNPSVAKSSERSPCPAQIDRAHFRDHIGRDHRDEFVEACLSALPLRHDLAQAAQKNPGAAGYELRRH